MATHELAAALDRAESVFTRRPQAGLHDDTPGMVRWQGGTRMLCTRPGGGAIETDLPPEFGGSGAHASPGWLVRAGLAACSATTIAMLAARAGIELDTLEVDAGGRSDVRGLLGMFEGNGEEVYPGPHELRLRVRVSARGVAPERLRALVDEANRCSPMFHALRDAIPLSVDVETGAA